MTEPVWVVPQPPEEAPLVSVLIPSHRPALLVEALDSVYGQTVGPLQVLVNFSPLWWGSKINDLASVARAPYLLILSDDDKLHHTYLARALDAIRGGFDFCYTDIQLFGDEGDKVYPLPEFGLNTFRSVVCPWLTALIRKSLWDSLGGFDPVQHFQDTDFWVRAAKAGARAAHIREPLHYARQHEGNSGKFMDATNAMIALQAKHPEVYPSAYVDPEGVKNSRNPFDHVQRVFVPRRFQQEGA